MIASIDQSSFTFSLCIFFSLACMLLIVLMVTYLLYLYQQLMGLFHSYRVRLLHIDYKHTDQEILSIVSKFLQKMEDSHYRKPAREEIIRSAVKKYWRMRLQEVIGVRDMNRTREDMNKEGRFKQMRTQTQFKSRRRGSPRDSGVVGEEQEL